MKRVFVPDVVSLDAKRKHKKRTKRLKLEHERYQANERAQARISFGTMTLFAPRPHDKIGDFTIAFSKSLDRSDLSRALADALEGSWGKTRSIHVVLSKPLAWRETRKRIKDALEPLLI